jgi:hypothetical protein
MVGGVPDFETELRKWFKGFFIFPIFALYTFFVEPNKLFDLLVEDRVESMSPQISRAITMLVSEGFGQPATVNRSEPVSARLSPTHGASKIHCGRCRTIGPCAGAVGDSENFGVVKIMLRPKYYHAG